MIKQAKIKSNIKDISNNPLSLGNGGLLENCTFAKGDGWKGNGSKDGNPNN